MTESDGAVLLGQPDRISDMDFERHRLMLDKLNEARRLQVRAAKLMGAWEVWAEELHERYGLAKDGSEGVEEDGRINRR